MMMTACSTKRRGYTLSEVLLVLGVIASAAALAQPALRSSIGDSRLRSAARQLRTELAKTRLKAMRSGTAQQFRYQFEQGRFEVAPANRVQVAEESATNQATEFATAASPQAGSQTPVEARSVIQELPSGVSFGPLQDPLAIMPDEAGWSQPIVFHPNGRTADATIRLCGERGAVVEVSLRGLTGVATTGKPRHEKALQ